MRRTIRGHATRRRVQAGSLRALGARERVGGCLYRGLRGTVHHVAPAMPPHATSVLNIAYHTLAALD
eukprot:3938029-Rhodomonas_salina.5